MLLNFRNRSTAAVLAAAVILPAFLFADNNGADPGYSGAPGDSTCISCHGTTLNSGKGSVVFSFADGATYTPGESQLVTVTVSDPAAKRWGFEASARLSSAPAQGAGVIAVSDSANTRMAGTKGTVQWITHSLSGTRNGTTGGVSFQFKWTAPATDVGAVDFYVAGNAANGNNQNDSGDNIYSAKATLTAATANKPAIQTNGVLNAASSSASIEAGSWVSIYGTNLAPTTVSNGRTWLASEIVNGKLPTTLDGVSVTINGKAAAVYFVSNSQLNVQAPDDTSAGPVPVVVTNSNGSSASALVTLQQFAPALFLFSPQSSKYPSAIFPDGTYLGPNALFGTALSTRPAKSGETVVFFGTGFGPTTTNVPSGQTFSGAAAASSPVTATIGGIPASVSFAGLSGAGLYQINVEVPPGTPSGDQELVLSVGGLSTQAGVFVAVQ